MPELFAVIVIGLFWLSMLACAATWIEPREVEYQTEEAGMKPHIYAEAIHAFANGKQVQYCDPNWKKWIDTDFPVFNNGLQWRVKPDIEYPETTMMPAEILNAWNGTLGICTGDLKDFANVVLRHAIDAGLVVTMDVHEAIVSLAKR